VFVGEKDRIELLDVAANQFQPLRDLSAAQTGVHQNRRRLRFDQRAIACAAASENCDLHPHEGSFYTLRYPTQAGFGIFGLLLAENGGYSCARKVTDRN